jgi:uncharacterized protein YndB with AHSA1/START domain
MKIELRPEQAYDEASARKATGKSLGDWFALLDEAGGPTLGRRDLGQLLLATHKLDPWWASTILGLFEAARGMREKDGRLKGYTICSTKSMKATPQACYQMFATAKALDRWLGPGHSLTLEEGGTLRNADGNAATLRKINPGKSIRMLWQHPGIGEDTPVEIKFAPSGAKTTVMITHERLQTREEADGLRAAWGAALERLKPLVEG